MSRDSDRVTLLDRRTWLGVVAIQPIPQGMPAAPIDRARLALWLCPCGTYGAWNDPARGTCRACGEPRAQ